LPEDEFFDAVETGLEKIEEDMQLRFKLRLQSQISQTLVNVPHEAVAEGEEAREEFGTGAEAKTHALWPEVSRKLFTLCNFISQRLIQFCSQIDRVCKEQLHYAREGVGQDGNKLFVLACY